MRLPGTPALRAWLAFAACVAVIWSFSGDAFAASETSRILVPLLRWLIPDLDSAALWQIHGWARKAAHLSEYTVLALLGFRALRLSLALGWLHVAGLTLLMVLGVAGLDELRQATLETRTGSVADVALDGAGGLLGVLLIVAFHRRLGVGPPLPKEGA